MAIAGRVAIVPKGKWSADATYKRLDAVTYNNTLYFAKKEVPAGTATSNTEYWSKSIVGGASAIATTEEAGIVKPDGTTITVDDDGTIHGQSEITVDGTTITLDEAKGIISLAKTLQDKIKTIDNKLPKTSVVNTNTTTEAGFALDARQANPNIEGTLAANILQLNNDLSDINGRMAINKYYVTSGNGETIEIDSIGFGIIIVNNDRSFGLYIYNKPFAIYMYTIVDFPGISFDIKSDSIVIKNIPIYTTIKVLQ